MVADASDNALRTDIFGQQGGRKSMVEREAAGL